MEMKRVYVNWSNCIFNIVYGFKFEKEDGVSSSALKGIHTWNKVWNLATSRYMKELNTERWSIFSRFKV
jgi:hypothetical protein